MARSILRVGIIGTGSMGASHARAFGGLPDVDVVSACDIDADRLGRFVADHGIPSAYVAASDLLDPEAIDAVAIVTPDDTHADLAVEALGRGIHVLCEKPLASTLADARRMARAAEASGVVHMVNLSYRRSAALAHARRIVRSGRIGALRHVHAYYLQSWLVSNAWGDWRTTPWFLWRLSRAHGSTGVLGDIGVHVLDFATYPTGDPESVQCTLGTYPKDTGPAVGEYGLDANDSASIVMRLADGVLGTVHMSRWATGHLNSLALEIHGDRGAIRVDLDQSYERLDLCMGRDAHAARWRTRTYRPAPTLYERFIRAVRTGTSAEPDFHRGADVQAMVDACFRSAESGRAEPVQGSGG